MIAMPKYLILTLGLVIMALLNNHCTSQHMTHPYTNHLIHESSPYLLQHAHNPVDWYPWGPEALKKAKDENKLMIISVGYAACHWCHVMERESFEDTTVARVMNEHFVCIKVDREERPDIDQIYMDAVMLMTQSGGWPLNCIALPDGRPIWGGTYFPKDRWVDALEQLSTFYKESPGKAEEYAANLTQGIKSMDVIIPEANPRPFEQEDISGMIEPWKQYFDRVEGGHSRAPKFPMPNNWLFLMRANFHKADPVLDSVVGLTLRKMAWGGIYDHLGGGFARYSTDKYWKVPHFEKMLYDNGQLVSLYSEAWTRNPDDLYRRTVYETLEWVEREMTSPEGGFYSSLDADSEGEEGKFYVWKYEEIQQALGEDTDWFCAYYQLTPGGNWEHGNNILIRNEHASAFAKAHDWDREVFLQKLEAARQKLMAVRDQRVRPGLDDKILTSWNALMLKGYVDAYRAFGDPAFLHIARRNAEFLLGKMKHDSGLYRNYKDGKASINAFLDDYALLAEALMGLYQVTMEEKWLQESDRLVQFCIQHFYDPSTGLFFYTSDEDPDLITRKYEITDNVIPASNSVIANVLFDLGLYLEKQDYSDKSLRMVTNMRKKMLSYGSGYSNWGILMLKNFYPHYEVVVAGPNAKGICAELSKHYLPNAILVAAENEQSGKLPLLENRFVAGTTKIYVCQNKTCKLPVLTVQEALQQMQQP